MTILTKKQWETYVADTWSASINVTYQNLIDEAVKAEREACAKVCEEQYEYYGHDHIFAKAIRARGQA